MTKERIWKFTKMQGVGNDFVVLDGVSQAIEMTPEIAYALADRHFGIGADQILLVDNPSHPEADFRYRIFNADGSEVEHCGNGARCFVRFVHQQHLSHRNPLKAEICTGLISLYEHPDQQVEVDMGQTRFDPEALFFDTTDLNSYIRHEQTLWQIPYATEDQTQLLDVAPIAISNPHAVLTVQDTENSPVQEIGAFLESHPRFANRVNVGFMQVLNTHEINLRVYERGVGETLACGTGACAAVAAGIRQGLLQSPVKVNTHGGQLEIHFDGVHLKLIGSAVDVFHGQINIDQLLKTIPSL